MGTAGDNSRRYSILIVDSQVLIQDFIKACLGDVFQVVSAYSAEQALNRLNSYGPFDIIISSLTLGGMGGLEFLSIVHEQHPSSIRILMSGNNVDDGEISRALQEGRITRFLLKPFSPSALKSQLKNDLASFNAIT